MCARSKKSESTEGVVLNNSYFHSVGRPLYSLCFLLPMVALYEFGTLIVNTDQIAHVQSRVAAFTWIMGIAKLLGVSQKIAWAFPGAVVIIIMISLQMVSSYSWKIRISWLFWMGFESLILTAPLFIIGMIMNGTSFSAGGMNHDYYAKLVTGVGAGIYEELVFRLIILGLLLLLLDDILRFGTTASILMATLISAVLFSAHHYIGIDMTGTFIHLETLDANSFLFRTAAGIYFALVFHYRGYGITAGTHAFYNVLLFTFFS